MKSAFGFALVLLLAAAPAAAQTPLDRARTAFNGCLSSIVKADIKERMAPDAFQAKLATACKAEEASFRTSSVAVDVKAGLRSAEAEQLAREEIAAIIANQKDTYQTYFDTNTAPR